VSATLNFITLPVAAVEERGCLPDDSTTMAMMEAPPTALSRFLLCGPVFPDLLAAAIST